jgi:two-component system response regulator HydG
MKNVIKRAALLSDGDAILAKTLPVEISNYTKFILNNGSSVMEKAAGKNHNLKEVALEAEYETILKVLKEVNFKQNQSSEDSQHRPQDALQQDESVQTLNCAHACF